jgi:23S rRNA pseudouridine1911/1915/1917 synthase
MKTARYTVDSQGVKKRVDLFLAEQATFLTRSCIKRLIASQLVTVNRAPVKASLRLRGGDVVEMTLPPPRESVLVPEPIPLDIIFEDDALIVINKPAGMVVHPAAGNYSGTLVHALLAHCPFLSGIGGVQRPGIVHRLDKDTSGLMVIVKSDAAHHHLSRQFKTRAVVKQYQALVCGRMKRDRGSIALEIGRHPTDRKKMSVHARKGRMAVSEWKLIEQFDECSLLEVGIKTGRTHQIRVHLAAVCHPIIGDRMYGGIKCIHRMANETVKNSLSRLNRPFLHACLLGFDHPLTGQRLVFNQPIPAELHALLTLLREEQCSSSA